MKRLLNILNVLTSLLVPQHRTLSIIEQFAAFLIWQDDAESIEDEIIPSILVCYQQLFTIFNCI